MNIKLIMNFRSARGVPYSCRRHGLCPRSPVAARLAWRRLR